VDVLAVHFDCGAIGRFREPNVEVFAFARFEEHDVVAVVEVGEFVELGQLRFGVEFGIFAAVREEGVEVGEEVAVSVVQYSISRRFVKFDTVMYTEMSLLVSSG
jgi:hypothetical protein